MFKQSFKGAFHYAKDSRNFSLNSMEGSILVACDQNIQDHLWSLSTYFSWNIPAKIHCSMFEKPVLCPD